MAKQYDRSAEDLGNIVGLEHVNLLVPDQGLATLFYISGLGLTRDPYLMTSVDNMWVNVGRSQFHLPTGKAQRLRGRTALVIPGRELLLKRLENMKKPLGGTQFAFKEHKDHVTATCPWGKRVRGLRAVARVRRHGARHALCRVRRAGRHGQGHRRFLRQGAGHRDLGEGPRRARLGRLRPGAGVPRDRQADRRLRRPSHPGLCRELLQAAQELVERKILTEESNQYQYRFNDLVDPATGKKLFEIEHEIRSITHPLYARPLVNRNPRQSNRNYVQGRDGWVPELEAEELPGRVRFG